MVLLEEADEDMAPVTAVNWSDPAEGVDAGVGDGVGEGEGICKVS